MGMLPFSFIALMHQVTQEIGTQPRPACSIRIRLATEVETADQTEPLRRVAPVHHRTAPRR